MQKDKPGLFGILHSNRDFTQNETWGKNQFNSSFPAGLANYLSFKGLENNYLILDKDMSKRRIIRRSNTNYKASPNDYLVVQNAV